MELSERAISGFLSSPDFATMVIFLFYLDFVKIDQFVCGKMKEMELSM